MSAQINIDYQIRPSKQVERRLFVDLFQRIAEGHFPIADYTYLGMGSVFFVDFIMFHRYLGIDKLISVEMTESIYHRAKFNKPFGLIDLRNCSASDALNTLNVDEKYIVWLDYDLPLTKEAAEDIRLASNRLSSGSFLIVSAPIFPGRRYDKQSGLAYYAEHLEPYLPTGAAAVDFSPDNILGTLSKAYKRIVQIGLQPRNILRRGPVRRQADAIVYQPLVYLTYADGRDMVTWGGMIGDASDQRRLLGCKLSRLKYVRSGHQKEPLHIKVPVMTRKERIHADGDMPGDKAFLRKKLKFSPEEVRRYVQFYRFLPMYSELFLG